MYSKKRFHRTYRNKTNGIYSPSNKNYNLPTYKQKVGRTLQASPRILTNNTTTMISRPLLDEYYKLLVRYKYPNLIPPPAPVINFEDFSYNIRTAAISYENWPEKIDLEFLYNNYVQSQLHNLPLAPTGYQYCFQLTSINFNFPPSLGDESRFSLSWASGLSSQPISLISKTLDTQYPDSNFAAEIFVIPGSDQSMRVAHVAFANNTIYYRLSNFNTLDRVRTDDTIYPLMSSAPTAETIDGQVFITKEGDSFCEFSFNICIFLFPTEY